MSVPSRIVIGRAPDIQDTGVFYAFGDRDDPGRLAVLIAEYISTTLPVDSEGATKARQSLAPKTTWKKRLALLKDALLDFANRSDQRAVLWDIDALTPAGSIRWDDDGSLLMRRNLFRSLLEAADQGGWIFVRSNPSKSVSSELSHLDVETGLDDPAEREMPEAKLFSPECRPIVAWLVSSEILKPRDLVRIVSTVEAFDEYIVQVAYDTLPTRSRDAAKILSALRPPQHRNGSLGPINLVDQWADGTALPYSAIVELEKSGLLQPGHRPKTERMPRAVRTPLARFAPLGMANEVHQLHERIATETLDSKPLEEQLEIHFHAVRAGNIERAKSTARFYGTELRDLARRIGIEASQEGNKAKFAQAADLFDHILNTFDSEDAYCWEYLGYNLARENAQKHFQRILDAYTTAHRLWRTNPLYHGRLLGFRGQLHQEVATDIIAGIDLYVQQYGDEREAVSRFVETSLAGLRRGNETAQIKRVMDKRWDVLARFAPRALQKLSDNP